MGAQGGQGQGGTKQGERGRGGHHVGMGAAVQGLRHGAGRSGSPGVRRSGDLGRAGRGDG